MGNAHRFAGFQLGGPCSASGVVGTWTTSAHNVGAFSGLRFPVGGTTDKAITQMIHAVWEPDGQMPTCPALTDYLDRTIVDVEGFGRGEATPLFVIPCISRSAGSACPGAVLRWECGYGGEDPRGGRRGVPRPDIGSSRSSMSRLAAQPHLCRT